MRIPVSGKAQTDAWLRQKSIMIQAKKNELS